MGGNGAYSMSFGNERTKISAKAVGGFITLKAKNISQLSDNELSELIAKTRHEKDLVGEQMVEVARYVVPGPNYSDAKRDEWDSLQDMHDELRGFLSVLIDEQLSREPQPVRKARKFVNSYGEATRRHVTTQTYEASQRRQEREIARRLGR